MGLSFHMAKAHQENLAMQTEILKFDAVQRKTVKIKVNEALEAANKPTAKLQHCCEYCENSYKTEYELLTHTMAHGNSDAKMNSTSTEGKTFKKITVFYIDLARVFCISCRKRFFLL